MRYIRLDYQYTVDYYQLYRLHTIDPMWDYRPNHSAYMSMAAQRTYQRVRDRDVFIDNDGDDVDEDDKRYERSDIILMKDGIHVEIRVSVTAGIYIGVGWSHSHTVY